MAGIVEKIRSLLTWLNIIPSNNAGVTIVEPYTYELGVYKNQIWYRGKASELHQFYTQIDDQMGNTSFWAARSTTGVKFRKIHSGVPSMMVDMLVDIVLGDLTKIDINPNEDTGASSEAKNRWEEIAQENNFTDLLKTALRKTLSEGDGAFKISFDSDISPMPIIEFYSGTRVDYNNLRNRLDSVEFLTKYVASDKHRYLLKETFSKQGVSYFLYDSQGNLLSLDALPQTAKLKNMINTHNFIMAVPMKYDSSPVWPGRGKSLFDDKEGLFDALDECVSQWMDTLRDARSTKYIPETLTPRNAETGELLRPNSFDNRYISTGTDRSEDGKNQISTIAESIPHDGLLASYITILDLCLQGIISPSTLGVDVKKLDNAEAQREKEKATLYTRNKIIGILETVIPRLVETVLKSDDVANRRQPGDYNVSVQFGEYANPSFEAQVETVGKARQYQIMSVEQAISELYGNTMTDEEKRVEIERLKAEIGIIEPEDEYNEADPGGLEVGV